MLGAMELLLQRELASRLVTGQTTLRFFGQRGSGNFLGDTQDATWLLEADSLTRKSRFGSLLAPTQYLFNSLHDWHFEILFIVAIILQLAHVFLQGL
jgi:hypothetical protein